MPEEEGATYPVPPRAGRSRSGGQTPAQIRAEKNDTLRKLETELTSVLAVDSGLSPTQVEAERSAWLDEGKPVVRGGGVPSDPSAAAVAAILADNGRRLPDGAPAAG